MDETDKKRTGEEGTEGEKKKRRVSRWDRTTTDAGAAAAAAAQSSSGDSQNAALASLSKQIAKKPVSELTRDEVAEKAQRAALISAQIQQQLASLNKMGAVSMGGNFQFPPPKQTFIPPPLVIDQTGKVIDQMMSVPVVPVATLKANQRKIETESKAKLKQKIKEKGIEIAPVVEISNEDNPYFDPNLKIAPATRRAKSSFNFVEDGRYSKKGESLRAKAALNEFYATKGKSLKETDTLGIAAFDKSTNPNLAALSRKPDAALVQRAVDPVPDIEWWDTSLLTVDAYDKMPNDHTFELKLSKITNLVEHPIPMEPPSDKAPMMMPIFLTEKERKKMRRRNRLEREMQKQELIRQGLAPLQEPKVKISNLMRVLGTEATQDPTKIEKEVRRQMAARVKAHDDRNQARKLTPEERREKKLKKLAEDQKAGIQATLYRVPDLSNKGVRIKIDKTAQDLFIKGAVIVNEECNLVIAEGGVKAMKKFTKLVIKRIKWENLETEEDGGAAAGGGEEDEEAPKGTAELVWQGSIAKHAFSDFQFQILKSDTAARLFLQRKNLEHYWDMAKNFRQEED